MGCGLLDLICVSDFSSLTGEEWCSAEVVDRQCHHTHTHIRTWHYKYAEKILYAIFNSLMEGALWDQISHALPTLGSGNQYDDRNRNTPAG